jgi:hypothetical protein
MNKSEYKEVINASIDQVWDVLFTQYGDIHVHNPTMMSSNYIGDATHGELNCVRHCQFNEKLFLDEQISQMVEKSSFTVTVTDHNLPFVREMSATYLLSAIADDVTEVKMTSLTSFSPRFMKYPMRGQMGKSLVKHLFGLKYYIETGKMVNDDNYSETLKSYKV